MVDSNENLLASEVEKRLEDLFGESGESTDFVEEPNDAEPEDSPLKELKATILSIDWEISDEIMDRLASQIASLKDEFRADSIMVPFLLLLDSIGRYIKVKKAHAHPDAVKVLNSVYSGLEKVALSKGLTNQERKRVLSAEVQRFKQLKEKIASTRVEQERKKGAKRFKELKQKIVMSKTTSDAVDTENAPEDLNQLLDQLKAFIRSEIKALRDELIGQRS